MMLQPEKPHAFAVDAIAIAQGLSAASGSGPGSELSTGLVQDLQRSGSSSGWNCPFLGAVSPWQVMSPFLLARRPVLAAIHCTAWAMPVPFSSLWLCSRRADANLPLEISFTLGNQFSSLRDYMLQGLVHCGVNSQQNYSPTLGNAEDWCFPPCASEACVLSCPQTISKKGVGTTGTQSNTLTLI